MRPTHWYSRFGVEEPFPWLLLALAPVAILCAAYAALTQAKPTLEEF